MAVRAFDLTEPQSTRLTALEPAPVRRHDIRRVKQRWAVVGSLAIVAPFVTALIIVGVLH